MKTIYLTGYRSFELGVFQENDPKIRIIKKVLKMQLEQRLEEGLEWLLLSGNLGIEEWAFDVAQELKIEYPDFSIGLIFPFEGFGEQWNEKNQGKLIAMKSKADYVDSVSHKPYDNPQQLRNHTQFLLTHSDGCLLIYDEEYEGKSQYFLNDANKFVEKSDKDKEFTIFQITMDDLQHSQDFE
ncbi:DUF1273 family protein [Vagococcus coleopterorum]|uniref:UPF0398 protein G7081_05075 n=1 Tax=Vagococcus coleopterorum TaxID=2714946 RepID=A0A6G8ANA8_9ENTE|nr:SLOG family protein [Vagococcus coleopterorum]QIL46486.1 DUF1273 family protein [Vagococcus coleopterorum]